MTRALTGQAGRFACSPRPVVTAESKAPAAAGFTRDCVDAGGVVRQLVAPAGMDHA